MARSVDAAGRIDSISTAATTPSLISNRVVKWPSPRGCPASQFPCKRAQPAKFQLLAWIVLALPQIARQKEQNESLRREQFLNQTNSRELSIFVRQIKQFRMGCAN